MTKYAVGKFNTGCENKVKQRVERVLGPKWTEAFEDCFDSAVTCAHLPQPNFAQIEVAIDVSIGKPEAALHFKSDFIVTMDEVRNLSTDDLDKTIDTRCRACVIELKSFIDRARK